MPAFTNAQRLKKRRDSRGDLEIRRDLDRRNEMRRSQLSQSMVQTSSTDAVGSSSSSSSAIHNVSYRINDSDEESAFSEDGLQIKGYVTLEYQYFPRVSQWIYWAHYWLYL